MSGKIVLTLLSLAAIFGIAFFAVSESRSADFSLAASANSTRATFDQWSNCLKTNNQTPFCNQATSDAERNSCQNAQAQVSYCQNSNRACNMFGIYYEEPTEDAPLPDVFYQCGQACQMYSTGSTIYSQNYNIKWVQCGYTN